MAQEIINYGASANDGTGDPLRNAFIKVDNNFDQIWNAGPVGSNITILNNTISVTNTNGNLVLNPNSIGIIETRNHLKPAAGNINDLGDSTLRYRSAYIGVGGVDIVGNLTLKGPQNLKIPGGSPTYVLGTNGNGNLSWVAQALSGDIAAETFIGDGSTATFTLTGNSTTGGTIVAINGVQQIPVSAYSVTNNILTFTEVPPAGYFIDVRLLVLTNGFTGGTPGGSDGQVQYNNNGNFGGATGFTFNNTSNVLIVPGDVIPSGNNTQTLGNATQQWNDLYLSNATIYMNSVPIGMTSGNVLTVNSQSVLTNNSSTTITTTGNITGNNISATSSVSLSVFANATVRDSTISSPTPGMMIYVTGTGMQVRGATSWNTIAGSGT